MARLLNIFGRRRRRLERDLARELRYHLDRRVEELMTGGLGEAEARRQAGLELGGELRVQEDVRDTWTWRWLDDLGRDARYALRSLARSWGFALGTGAVLALGTGATIAMFSVVHTVLLRPLAYPDAERIVAVETLWTNAGRSSPGVSEPDFLDWQAQNDVFEVMAHFDGEADVAIVVGERAEFANDMYVSPGFFTVFGQPPAAGRLLTERDVPADDANPAVAVVGYHWAVSHFGTAQAAIGRTITVYGMAMEIVGVAARGFSYPDATDLWAPVGTSGTNRSAASVRAVGKLRAGVDVAQARAQMRAIGDGLARRHPENRLKTVALHPLAERLTGDVRTMLWVLMAAVSVVLLIACANTANLLLARAAARTREIALRAALGAGRSRVVRQLLTESAVLGGSAGCLGLALAALLGRALVVLSPADLPRLAEVHIDGTVLLFSLGLSLACTLLVGLVPAIHASRLDLSEALKQGGSRGATSGGLRVRTALVVAEVAPSVVLLTAAGLLLRSFQELQRTDLGFTTNRVVVAYTQYVASDDAARRNRTIFYAELLERLRAVPGVSAAAGVAFLPMGREHRSATDFFVEGRPEGPPGARPRAELHAITPDYFRTLEIPIRVGRDFDETDTLERPLVVVVNESLARTTFPGESPLGRRLRRNTKAAWMEIVGVVADSRWQDPSRPSPPVIYAASAQGLGGSLSILARTSLDEATLAGTLRTLLHDADPTVPVRFESMQELFADALAYPRFRTRLIGAFAGVAALLAAVGLFSVLAYVVGQRTREIAIRRAVGARAADIVRLVAGEGLRLVAAGLLLGLAGALAVAHLLTSLLHGIGPRDAVTYLGAVIVLAVASLFATLLPAIRAASIPPAAALQQD
jgi:putative ABC transport system permease protein